MFIARLTRLVLEDAAVAGEQAHQVWARPREERVAAGRALADLRVTHIAPNGMITLTCLDAATSLESPIVFVLGSHKLIAAEGSLRITDEERTERVRDTTRRLYMAKTRAGQRLVFTYVGTPPLWLQP